MLVDIFFRLELIEAATGDLLRADQFSELLQRAVLRAEVEVMKEGILFVPDIDKRRVKSLDYLFYRTQVDVTDYKLASFLVFMEFYKLFVLKKGYSTSVLS